MVRAAQIEFSNLVRDEKGAAARFHFITHDGVLQ
jgi:hypothetical protein